MNICLVLVSTGWGGAEAVVHELARRLTDRGNKVTILVNREMLGFFKEFNGARLLDLGQLYPFKAIALSKLGATSKYDLPRRLVSAVCTYLDELYLRVFQTTVQRDVTDLIAKNAIEVVHSHLVDDTILISDLHASSIRMVATVHGLLWREPTNILFSPLTRYKEARNRKALNRRDRITTVSAFMLEALGEWDGRLKQRITVIPNGISVSRVADGAQMPSKLRGNFNLLFPGGTKVRKGGPLLIRALALVKKEIPDIHAYLTGHVPENHPLRAMVREMGLQHNVTFTGFLSLDNYRSLLRSVDVLVMPSRDEPFGLVYLEAMAMGKPVVAGKTGAVPEVVQDCRNGLLVDLAPEHIAAAVLRLYRNRDFAVSIRESNLRDATRFDWDVIVGRYVKLYKDLTPSSSLREIPLRFCGLMLD